MNEAPNLSPQDESYAVVDEIIEAKAGKFLTFRLAGEVFGIEILKVQEIIGIMKITRVPSTLHFVRGVINLRGKVIPVADLRQKFEMETQEDTEKTCVIVVRLTHADREITIGILVDEVCEVLNIKDEQLEETPEFGTNIDTQFILGMGKLEEFVVILLNIDKILAETGFILSQQL